MITSLLLSLVIILLLRPIILYGFQNPSSSLNNIIVNNHNNNYQLHRQSFYRTTTKLYAKRVKISKQPERVARYRPAKDAKIEKFSNYLTNATMILQIPAPNITSNEIVFLRRDLPEGVHVHLVKNTLMRKVIEKNPLWESMTNLTRGSNYCFFVLDENKIRATFEKISEVLEANDRLETHKWKFGFAPKMGILAEKALDDLTKLPKNMDDAVSQIINILEGVPHTLIGILESTQSSLIEVLEGVTRKDDDKNGNGNGNGNSPNTEVEDNNVK